MTVRRPAASALGLAAVLIALAGAALAGAALAGAALAGPRQAGAALAETDPQTALYRGNRLFREGRIEAAAAAYLEGYSPQAPHPTLLYNLGTALHHLDRLPEAILWYRRAAGADDPWLDDNLWLARRSLGSQRLPAAGVAGWLARHAGGLRRAAILLSWAALALVAVRRRVPARAIAAAAAAAIALYGGGAAVERWGPRPAVILEPCSTPTAELPAGAEVWVRPAAGGRWRISGFPDLACPGDSLELVFPPGSILRGAAASGIF